jgi:hypothetical protein
MAWNMSPGKTTSGSAEEEKEPPSGAGLACIAGDSSAAVMPRSGPVPQVPRSLLASKPSRLRPARGGGGGDTRRGSARARRGPTSSPGKCQRRHPTAYPPLGCMIRFKGRGRTRVFATVRQHQTAFFVIRTATVLQQQPRRSTALSARRHRRFRDFRARRRRRQKEASPSCPDLDCCEDRRQAVPEKSGGGRRRKRIMPPPPTPTPTPPPHTPPASDPEPVKAYGRGQGSRRRRRRRREPCRDNDGDLLLPAADDAAPSP